MTYLSTYNHNVLNEVEQKKSIENLSAVILSSEQIYNLKRLDQHPMTLEKNRVPQWIDLNRPGCHTSAIENNPVYPKIQRKIVYKIYSGCLIGIQWVFEGL